MIGRIRVGEIAYQRVSELRLIALAMCVAVGVTGCGKSNGEVTVHGHVTYKGQPLAASSVSFFPSTGRIVTAGAPQGEYSAELKPGEYVVTIGVGIEYPKGFKEGDPVPAPKVVLPDEYTVRVRSTLKATVSASQSGPIDFDLK